MDPISAILLFGGSILLTASWIQLIISASNDDFTWALCAIFIPPLAYLYGLSQWRQAADAIKMALLGLGMLGLSLS